MDCVSLCFVVNEVSCRHPTSGICDENVQSEPEKKRKEEATGKRFRHRATLCDKCEAFTLEVEAGAEADARFRG